jgi:hypothetical protein
VSMRTTFQFMQHFFKFRTQLFDDLVTL